MVAVEDESSCACRVWMGFSMAVHCAVSIWTGRGTIRSMPIRAGVPASPIITTKDAQPVADTHFRHR